MATMLATAKSTSVFQSVRLVTRTAPWTLQRALSTLSENPHIYVHDQPTTKSYLLSYLPTSPANASLAIGTTTQLPPRPDSFTPNPAFLDLIHTVLATHAVDDPDVRAQAQVHASQAGAGLGSGGVFFPRSRSTRQPSASSSSSTSSSASASASASRKSMGSGSGGGDGAGGASAQGGMGGGARGGHIHVSDARNPPDFGRVAWAEDIFGSLEVDGAGAFVDGTGRYQRANTYRVVTREGILGLSPFLREKVVRRLEELETQAKAHG